jgi:PHD/YefM family antitoxin component YafN of YafNO toxin-antitoxin module
MVGHEPDITRCSEETEYLLRSPENARRLTTSTERLESG